MGWRGSLPLHPVPPSCAASRLPSGACGPLPSPIKRAHLLSPLAPPPYKPVAAVVGASFPSPTLRSFLVRSMAVPGFAHDSLPIFSSASDVAQKQYEQFIIASRSMEARSDEGRQDLRREGPREHAPVELQC
ncbi:uncharacterized protein LOC100824093 isoform X1 [Brachypodium distachyon]|uniref:uncharacterized protein LOC100824093 isoform X1 n=1 Tax=Brachypodium distachyon TaxID=15368 RepID=UPI00071C24AA|nr:uncharacterized protein LOC100824093 isoform X1 [Brachypodium distachyon]|eukprot:XP_014756505.1 uncharacterized protein LOC100824093 isoform X1 [Brachypodium distachyon]